MIRCLALWQAWKKSSKNLTAVDREAAGCRASIGSADAARNGGEAAAAVDFELDQYMQPLCVDRGILMTPFHNMALVSPYTSEPTSIATRP